MNKTYNIAFKLLQIAQGLDVVQSANLFGVVASKEATDNADKNMEQTTEAWRVGDWGQVDMLTRGKTEDNYFFLCRNSEYLNIEFAK